MEYLVKCINGLTLGGSVLLKAQALEMGQCLKDGSVAWHGLSPQYCKKAAAFRLWLRADTATYFATWDLMLNQVCHSPYVLALLYAMKTDPDPHGQAALMLCESLMLLLIEEGIIRKTQAVDAIGDVIDVKREIAGTKESVVVSVTSIALLKEVAQSISAARSPPILAVS